MTYAVILRRSAERNLERLPREIQQRIKRHIDDLSEDPRPATSTPLVGQSDLRRVRVGDYRIVYSVDDDDLVVVVEAIDHRKDIYRTFNR